MKLYKALFLVATLVLSISCFEEEQKNYPKMESLANTSWFSYTTEPNGSETYYTIVYNADNTGKRMSYSTPEREELLATELFKYSFEQLEIPVGLISNKIYVYFEDGRDYCGSLIQKGYIQINMHDVYYIQLHEINENGEMIKNEDNTPASLLTMWCE